MKKITLLAVVVCALTVPMYAKKATVKIINQSKWEIHHIFLSSSDDQEWGPDQLEDEVLAKGDSLTLTGIDCDLYDIQVVDEDGDEWSRSISATITATGRSPTRIFWSVKGTGSQ